MALHRGFSRRALIEGLGLGGAAFLLPSLRTPRLHAAPKEIPKRLIIWWNGCGSLRQTWSPKAPAGMAAATETGWELGPLHTPLEMHKKDLIFLDGLGMKSRTRDGNGYRDAHEPGNVHSLTANSQGASGQISIDQFIARGLNKPTPVTLLPSLEMSIAADGGGPGNRICYSGPGQTMPMMNDPRAIYRRFFGMPAGGGAAPGAGDAARAMRAAKDKSVLDAVAGDFQGLAGKLSGLDRQRLEAHADAVRDMEKRLAGLPGAGSAPVSCGTPPDPAFLDGLGPNGKTVFEQAWQKPPVLGAFKKHVDAHVRVLQAALACDLTRVVTINVEEIPNGEWGFKNGDFGATDAHDLIHKTSPRYGSGGLWNNATAVERMSEMLRTEARYLAQLVSALKAVKEADGSTVFDHTMILWCGQIAEGWHSLDGLPWVLLGGAGAFKTGRFLKYPNKPHNDLFVSIANAMGVQTQKFGNPETCTGPLAGL